MRFRIKHVFVVVAGIGVIAAACAFIPNRLDAKSFSARIDSAVPAYDGFDIQTTLTNESRASRHLLVRKVIFELRSGSRAGYVTTEPLDQDVPGRGRVNDAWYPRTCPTPDHDDDHFRLVYVLTEPYEPPPRIVHNAYSLFLDRGPPTWFTDLYEPRTHEVATQWFPIPKPETKNKGEQGGAGNPAKPGA